MLNKEEIKNFFEDNFMADFDESFTDDDSLLENGIMDSTGVLELVQYLEERFNISIDNDELIPENLDSITKIENFVKKKAS